MNTLVGVNNKRLPIVYKKREYLFDNLKGLLIFLVILGHFIELEGMNSKSTIFKSIWIAIYSFHMPLFIFITGYFTKKDPNNTKKTIKNYLIPYIIFNVLIYLFEVYILRNDKAFKLMVPQFAMWFLLTIFFYKIIYNGIYKVKGILVLSIISAVIVGFDTSFATTASLSRTVAFLPFFIAGNKFKKEYLMKIDSKKIKYILAILVIIILLLFGFVSTYLKVPTSVFTFKYPYESQKLSNINAMLARIIVIGAAFIFSYFILNIIPNHKTKLSSIGQNTMTVYILHVFVIRTFEILNILKDPTFFAFIISLLMSIIIIYIASRPMVKKAYDKMINKVTNLIGI